LKKDPVFKVRIRRTTFGKNGPTQIFSGKREASRKDVRKKNLDGGLKRLMAISFRQRKKQWGTASHINAKNDWKSRSQGGQKEEDRYGNFHEKRKITRIPT